MPYKMIVLDLDDTLLCDDHTISPRTKEALRMLGVLENTTVRPPLLPIQEFECETIRHALEEAGLLLSPVER